MARIRSIKPETFTSDDVNALSHCARWTFVGLWCYVDDAGRGRADARLIKAAVWPIDDTLGSDDVTGHLDEMERRQMICRYEVEGVEYMHVVAFDVHQRINRPTPSRLPPCSKDVHGGLPEPSPIDPGPLTDSSVSPPGEVPDPSPLARRPARAPDLDLELGTGNREQGSSFAAGAPEALPAGATVTQRSKRITDEYAAIEPMCKWPAVNAIVIKAIKTERWSDEEIRSALVRLAKEKRGVSVETMRVELDGLQPYVGRASPVGQREVNGHMLSPETVANIERTNRLAVYDAVSQEYPMIEGRP